MLDWEVAAKQMGWGDESRETACPFCDYRQGYYVLEGSDDIGDNVRCAGCSKVYKLTYGCFKPIVRE